MVLACVDHRGDRFNGSAPRNDGQTTVGVHSAHYRVGNPVIIATPSITPPKRLAVGARGALAAWAEQGAWALAEDGPGAEEGNPRHDPGHDAGLIPPFEADDRRNNGCRKQASKHRRRSHFQS